MHAHTCTCTDMLLHAHTCARLACARTPARTSVPVCECTQAILKHTHNHARFDRMDKFKAMDAIRDGCLEMDRIQPRVERILCNAAALQAKATKYGIDVALEESIAGAKRKASTLALTVMRLALEHLSENDGQMMKTFKLAFRIHQFAGGFDGEETAQCYREIHQLLSA